MAHADLPEFADHKRCLAELPATNSLHRMQTTRCVDIERGALSIVRWFSRQDP